VAVPLSKLEASFVTGKWEQYLVPAADALPDLPIVKVDGETLKLVANGHRIPAEPDATGLARAIGPNGELVAVLEAVDGCKLWHPRKVFWH
jgi:tRNA pseudouridine55 synthase